MGYGGTPTTFSAGAAAAGTTASAAGYLWLGLGALTLAVLGVSISHLIPRREV